MSAPLPTSEVEAGHSLWQDAWLRLRKNKMAVAGAVVVIILTLASFSSPFIPGLSYSSQNLELGASKPNAAHWFGTDDLGRDLFARILFGGCISLSIGLVGTLIAIIIGVAYGTISGYIGGRLDVLMMRIVDILYSLPLIIFIVMLMVVFRDAGNQAEQFLNQKLHFFTETFGFRIRISAQWNTILVFVAVGATEWLDMARIIRAQTMSLKKQEFIEAAQALGLRKRHIMLRHLVPNMLGVVIIFSTLIVPRVMLTEAFLSFLGLGVQSPMSSWGVLINEGSRTMEEFPWLMAFPAAFFSLTLFSLNFLGDGLRDALDVRASKD